MRIRPLNVCRVALFVALAGLSATTSFAQTSVVVNPRVVEFVPSTDHSATLGGAAVVSRYAFRAYQIGAEQPFHEIDLGKPAPGADGLIRADFSNTIGSWPLPGGPYEARVAAVGPAGEGVSDASNPFTVSSCSFTLSGAGALFPAAGGGGSVGVTAADGCSWTAAAGASWVTLLSQGGSGSGAAGYAVAANTATSARATTLTVGGLPYQVDQEGACGYAISSSAQTFAAAGGSGSVTVTTTGSGCGWTVSSGAAWIVANPASGTGSGSVTYQVTANTGAARTGTVTIAGAAHTVSQAAAAITPPPPPPPPSTLPAPWQGQDVGVAGVAGSDGYASGVFTIAGAGAGIGGAVDAFHFVSQPMQTTTTITARVSALGTTNGAKAGIMIRNGVAAGATHVALHVRAGGVVEFVQRTSAGGTTKVWGSTTQGLPAWLRLARSGAKVTASVSTDGLNWKVLGSRSANMASPRVGLAVTSGDPGACATATVDNVVVK